MRRYYFKLTQISAGLPCGKVPRKCVTTLSSLLRGQRRVAAAVFRESGVRSAMFREQALLHCTTLFRGRRECPAAKFREQALLHYLAHCADNRNVILSRRACGASKNLPRLPQSDYNAIMPMLRPLLSFRLSERQRTHGEISHIVRILLQCTLHAYTFQAFISYPGDFSTAHGFTRAPLEMTCCGTVAGRVKRGLLKAEFAGAIVYFFLPGFTVAKSCFANHTSIALFIIRLVITEYVVFTIM